MYMQAIGRCQGRLQIFCPVASCPRRQSEKARTDRLADAGRARLLEDLAALRWKLLPAGPGPEDRFHEGEPTHARLVAHRTVEAERRAPIVYDEGDAVEPERLEETVDVARVIDEAIADIGFVGAAHADQIGRDAAADAAHMRDYVAPQIRRRWIAVQKHDRIAAALVDVGHACAVHLDVANRERKIGRDRRRLMRIVVTHVGSFKLTVPGPPGGSVHALSG